MSERDDDGGARASAREVARRTAPAELVTGAIGALLVLGALSLTVSDAFRSPGGPPVLTIQQDSVASTDGGHLVIFTVRNGGAETAAAVQVHGKLTRAGETLEESNATIDYVPEGANRRGALLFRENPGAHDLELRVTGFSSP